jgi:hypothetical protein
MKNKLLMLSGILAPIVDIFAVVLGGILWKEYSHLAQPVSDLLARNAPTKAMLDPIFGVYNLLTIAFGFGLLQYVRGDEQNRRKTIGLIGAWVLIAEGIFGFFDIVFCEDAYGGMAATISTTGMLHIVFAGLCSLSTMLAILLLGFWFRENPRLRGYGLYSFISVAIIFITGGITAYSVANHTSLGGFFERITQGAWLQWLFFVGLKMIWLETANRQKVSQ